MKKKIIIMLLLLIPLTACTRIDDIIKTQEQQINESIKDYRSITKDSIKESFEYIENNFKNTKDKNNLIYHATYLIKVGEFNKSNNFYILGEDLIKYLKKDIKKTQIQEDIDMINKNKSSEIEKLYKEYQIHNPIKKAMEKETNIALADSNDTTLRTKEMIKKSVDYIDTHITNVLENEEVLEKVSYYTLFLSYLSNKDTTITSITNETKSYLNTLDENTKVKIIELLKVYKNNESKEINNFYNNMK